MYASVGASHIANGQSDAARVLTKSGRVAAKMLYTDILAYLIQLRPERWKNKVAATDLVAIHSELYGSMSP
jgi:hypothetical protein